MVMYALANLPLIHQLGWEVTQSWYTDDASAGGSLGALSRWWDKLNTVGPKFGYQPNACKTCLIVKPEHLKAAELHFQGTGVMITTRGQRHLGAALGDRTFVEEYVVDKVSGWVKEIEELSTIAKFQPQAAHTVLIHGLMQRWTFLMRTIPDAEELFQPLEAAIQHQFLPVLTGRLAFSDAERKLIALPAQLGGLGIPIPTRSAKRQQESCEQITAALLDLISKKVREYPRSVQQEQRKMKTTIQSAHREKASRVAENVKTTLTKGQQNAVEQASERGASMWLTAIPMAKYGFQLHEQAFRNVLCLRFGWTPKRLPSHCPCGKAFSVEHAFSCPKGALPSNSHNRVRDITAHLLTEVCPNVGIEPNLQPLTGESFPLRSINVEEGARLDIRAQDVWDSSKRSAYFDVRVFNSYAPSNSKSSTKACYRRHEEKRREYERRILEVEHGTFTPLVMSASGGWGPSATVAFKRLAGLIAAKQGQSYSRTLQFI